VIRLMFCASIEHRTKSVGLGALITRPKLKVVETEQEKRISLKIVSGCVTICANQNPPSLL